MKADLRDEESAAYCECLIQAAEEGLLAKRIVQRPGGQPFGEFLPPQVQRKGLQAGRRNTFRTGLKRSSAANPPCTSLAGGRALATKNAAVDPDQYGLAGKEHY